MTMPDALAEIAKFWNHEPLPFGSFTGSDHAARRKNEFTFAIPEALDTYVREFAPAADYYFDTVGNPMRVYGLANLKQQQDGYNFNSVTGIPKDLPKLMTIDKFHFISAYDKSKKPSTQETYQLIAKVFVSKDTSFWKPALPANNHWTNWESGNL